MITAPQFALHVVSQNDYCRESMKWPFNEKAGVRSGETTPRFPLTATPRHVRASTQLSLSLARYFGRSLVQAIRLH